MTRGGEQRLATQRGAEPPPPRNQLHCGLLLELPDPAMERAFWGDEHVARTYASADLFTACACLLGNMATVKAFASALPNISTVPGAWHFPAIILSGMLASLLTMGCILARPKNYVRHREGITIVNRLLRLGTLLLTSWARTPAVHSAMGSSLLTDKSARSVALVGLLNLKRPLFFSGIIYMAQGDMVWRFKQWLPVQVLTLLLVFHGALRYQPCFLANEPHIALILQSTCRAIPQMHQLMLASVLGVQFMPRATHSPRWADAVCGDLLAAARVVAWFSHAAYNVAVPCCVYGPIEWRLKAAWVHKRHNAQLCYGPFGWPRSSLPQQEGDASSSSTVAGWLTTAAVYLIGLSTASWLLWLLALWLVPMLPAEQCELVPCVDSDADACPSLANCEGFLCQNPGLAAALLIYIEFGTCFFFRHFIHRHIMHRL